MTEELASRQDHHRRPHRGMEGGRQVERQTPHLIAEIEGKMATPLKTATDKVCVSRLYVRYRRTTLRQLPTFCKGAEHFTPCIVSPIRRPQRLEENIDFHPSSPSLAPRARRR